MILRNRFTLLGEKNEVAREPSSAAASAGAAATTASAPRRGEAKLEKVADRDAGTRAWTRGARRAARDASARIPTRAATMGEWTAVVMVRSVRPCRGEWRARERRSATFSVIHLAASAACGSTEDFAPVKKEQRLARCANRHQFIANAVEMDEPADEVIFVVRLRGLRVA
jgi:hypothetical protein